MVAFTHFVLAASLAGFAVAQNAFRVTNPSAESWWVAKSANVLAWTCSDAPAQTFTVLVANSNPAILVAPIGIIAVQNNFDCSKVITQDQANQAPGTGYRVLLANPLNNTDIYAQSEEFEIRPLGSAYPATTTSSGPSATGSGAAASGSGSPQQNNGAVSKGSSMGVAAAFAAGLAYLI